MSPSDKPLLVFVVGPTATGKSDFAVEAALRFGGEVINVDSVQIYQSVEIGSAKPTLVEQKGIAHHLFGVIPEGEECTAGEFRKRALEVIAAGAERGQKLFIAVGGSGFYVQALEKGMYPVPEISDAIRAKIKIDFETLGREALYRELEARDPDYAKEISINDTYRLFRALEIARCLQGEAVPEAKPVEHKTWSGLRKKFEAEVEATRPFRVIKIGLTRDRKRLRVSVAARVRKMIERGLVEEVEVLRKKGLSSWAPLSSVGYKEVQDLLDKKISAESVEELIATHTMQLAKRQMTWFRRDSSVRWFDADKGWAEPLAWLDSCLHRKKDEGL